MRQYQLFYKRLGSLGFSQLQPNVHATLYNRPAIDEAVDYMRDHTHVEGMSIRIGTEQFNVIASDQDELTHDAFEFPSR